MTGADAAAPRCPWVDLGKPDSVAYHDREWGVPVHDDRTHFEFLVLEGAQAGLSWQGAAQGSLPEFEGRFCGFAAQAYGCIPPSGPVLLARPEGVDLRNPGPLAGRPGALGSRK